MDRKREIFDKVLALVRNELWGEPLACTVSTDDVDEVLRIAQELNVAGMAANAVIRNQLPVGDDGAMQAWGIQQKHKQTNEDMNAEIVHFTDFLDKRDNTGNYLLMSFFAIREVCSIGYVDTGSIRLTLQKSFHIWNSADAGINKSKVIHKLHIIRKEH